MRAFRHICALVVALTVLAGVLGFLSVVMGREAAPGRKAVVPPDAASLTPSPVVGAPLTSLGTGASPVVVGVEEATLSNDEDYDGMADPLVVLGLL